MSNNVYIKQTLVEDHSVSELDFEMHREFGFDYDTHSDFVTIHDGYGQVDNVPIKIEDLENILKTMKEKGATHISLDYHCDHLGYEMSGYIIKGATPEEIDAFLGKKKARKEKSKKEKIARLKSELEKLENE